MKSKTTLASSSLFVVLLLVGCSTSFVPAPYNTGTVEFGAVSGTVHGGQAPIIGAHIYAYQTSISGYGAASTSLLGATDTGGYTTTKDGSGNYYVTSDSKGYFQISKTTTCTTNRVVYLYSLTGNPGAGINAAAGLMAVLGTCPASGLLINAITTGTAVQIYMNEVSTVAAAYALSGFATSATAIGNTGTALGNTGIQNAAANAGQMYTAVATSDGGGGNNGSTRVANATTPGGNGTVPQAKLDTLANILAACINTAGPEAGTACSNLFADIKSAGTTGTTATDTATAAIYIAHNPLANVTALYNIAGSTANPFNPALTGAPHDFTVELSFTGGGLAPNQYTTHTIAIDTAGNAWHVSTEASALSKFSPLGVPVNASGYAEGFASAQSVAIDTAGNIWVCDYASDGGVGSVYKINSAGTKLGTYTTDVGAARDIALDGSSNVWVAEFNHVLKLDNSGNVLVYIQDNSQTGVLYPYGVAIEPGTAGNVWIADYGDYTALAFTNSGAVVPGSPFPNTVDGPLSDAVDSTGAIWFANDDGTVSKLNASGTPISGSPISTGAPNPGETNVPNLALDGAGNVWLTDDVSSVRELSSSGTNLSTTAGFTPSATAQPSGIAIDGSGDVWYDTVNDSSMREIIGAAIPVVTPLSYGVANSKLGARP